MPERDLVRAVLMFAVFYVHIGWFTNLRVNTVFASVPIIHTYTKTAEEMTVNTQVGGGWILLCK
jgi:hypothetical protein